MSDRWTPPQPVGLAETLRHHLPPAQAPLVDPVEQLEAIVRTLAVTSIAGAGKIEPLAALKDRAVEWVAAHPEPGR